MNNQNSKCCGSSVTAISSDEGTSYYQCNRCLQPTDVISKCCEKCHAYIKAFPSSPNCDNPNCHCHTSSKCCEKCVDVYFEKDYPAHTAHESCINPICECHTTSKSEAQILDEASELPKNFWDKQKVDAFNSITLPLTRLENWEIGGLTFDEIETILKICDVKYVKIAPDCLIISSVQKNAIGKASKELKEKMHQIIKKLSERANVIVG